MGYFLRVLSFIIVFSAAGCGRDDQERESYETNSLRVDFGHKYFYYIEDDAVVRGLCPDEALAINRENCPITHRVLASAFFDASEVSYLDQIEKKEDELNQYVVLIADLDFKISQLLDSVPTYNRSLLSAVSQRESLLTDVEIRIKEIKDQISRIESGLLAGEDKLLRAFLHEQLSKLELNLQEKSEIRKSVAAIRRQHLDINNGILGSEIFRDLIAQREKAVNNWNFAESSLAFNLNRFSGYLAAVKQLKDGGIWNATQTSSMDNMTSRAVNHFGPVFMKLHASQLFPDWEGSALLFLVAQVDATLSEVSYTNNNSGGNCSGVKIEHKNFTLVHKGNNLYAERSRIANYPHLAPLFSQKVTGRLVFTPICDGLSSIDDIVGSISLMLNY